MQLSHYQLAGTIEADRHRDEARRHAHERALRETRAARPGLAARLLAVLQRLGDRNRRAVTDFACRLPDGRIGVTAFIQHDGEWLLVCRVA